MGLFGQRKLKEEDYYFTLEHAFLSAPQEDYSPDVFTYGHAYAPFVQLMAKDWFGSKPVTVREALKSSKVINPSYAYSPLPDGEVDFVGEPNVDEVLLNSYHQFDNCERISWGKSSLATKWQSTLQGKGVKVDCITSPQDSSIEIIMGTWVLFDGHSPLPILGEAWRNKETGKEFLYWFIDALCRTRPTNVPPNEYPSHQFYYPELLQRVGYLSETIFPSSMVRIRDRMAEFGVEELQQVPKAVLHVETDYYVMGISSTENELNFRVDWSPETTRYGYIIDESIPFESTEEIIIQLVNALPKVASILMDGFSNWNDSENLNFQDELFHDLLIDEKLAQQLYKVGFTVPGPAYCALAWKSVMSYALLDQLERDRKIMSEADNIMFHRGGLFRLCQQGIGPSSVHAVNSLYFRIIKQEDVSQIDLDGREKITELLNYFSRFQFDRQDANALSNLAMLQSAWGNYAAALDTSNRGLSLFNSDLSQKFISEMSGGGPFYPIIIKWELYLTKARVLILMDNPNGAKEPLIAMIREARALQFEGEELNVAEKLLETL